MDAIKSNGVLVDFVPHVPRSSIRSPIGKYVGS